MTDFIPNHVTKAVGGLKKDLSNSSTISSKKLAERTLAFLEDSLTQINKNNPDISLNELVELVKKHSDALQVAAGNIIKDDSHTFSVIINNLTLRILKILRSDCGENGDGLEDVYDKSILTYKSFFGNAITGDFDSNNLENTTISSVFETIEDFIDEIRTELDNLEDTICSKAMEHIKPGTILTVGYDKLVFECLKKAHDKYQKDPIACVVVEALNGRKMYTNLKKLGVNVTLVPDSNLHVVLNQNIDIVFLGAELVLADGSCRVQTGTHTISALCAKSKNIPVIITAGLHCFCPSYPQDIPIYSGNVDQIIENSEKNADLDNALEPQDVIFPANDDISADFISFFVVNDEAQVAPSFVYRKLADMYHSNDY